jgi:porphobilinogen deaminase
MGWYKWVSQILDPEDMFNAVEKFSALAAECWVNDDYILDMFSKLSDVNSEHTMQCADRAELLEKLSGGCSVRPPCAPS